MRSGAGRARFSHGRRRRAWLAAWLLTAMACSPAPDPVEIGAPSFGAGSAQFEIVIGADLVPGTLEVRLDGVPVTSSFASLAWGARGSVPVAPGTSATLSASARFLRGANEEVFSASRAFTAPVPAPPLVSSDPAEGASGVPRTAWLRLDFAAAVAEPTRAAFRLDCGSAAEPWSEREISVAGVSAESVVVNPAGELPAGARCGLSWPGEAGLEVLLFETAAAGAPAEIRYDRTDRRALAPWPDDAFLVEDASTPTGLRIDVPSVEAPADVQFIVEMLRPETNRLDGFSPIAHFVVELSDAPDPGSLPATPAESLDPLATVALLDLSSGPGRGQRIPFRCEPRTDTSVVGVVSHSLLVFPSIPLAPHGRYGLVVTRRVLVSPERPFAPSPFLAAALAPLAPGEAEHVTRVRDLVAEVLAVASEVSPPLLADDVALALRISVRSVETIPNDLRAVKEQMLAAPAPAFTVTKVTPETSPTSDVAAIVEGTWQAPDWRSNGFFVRDGAGEPVQQSTRSVGFVLALPKAALEGSVPITMYQHGNPGSAEREVPSQARKTSARSGFAVIGFTDPLNREVAPGETDTVARITAQVFAVFLPLTQYRRLPDYWVQTNAEQIAFLRLISSLGSLDLLPIGAPDGVPDLDPTLPLTYVGISEGANHGPGLLPYAPEIEAAALVVGGRRFTEVMIHQQAATILSQLGGLFQSLSPAEIWTALALFQGIFDVQDEHNHARFIYRDPFPVAGTTKRASVLVTEGLDDSLVPNHATESLAYEIGPIPHLLPIQRTVAFLPTATGPLEANVDPLTTAGFFQFVPTGVAGIPPTPGCAALAPSSGSEGHYCAQSAEEALRQREAFFESALSGVPRIIDPFTE